MITNIYRNTVHILIVCIVALFSSVHAKSQAIDVHETFIHKAITRLLEATESFGQKVAIHADLHKAQRQFEEIVEQFNHGVLAQYKKAEQEYRGLLEFKITIKSEDIRLWHLRELRNLLEKSNKMLLDVRDQLLQRRIYNREHAEQFFIPCNNFLADVRSFNKLFLEKVLVVENFDSGFLENIADMCILEPYDWMKKHPYISAWIATTVALAIISGIWWYKSKLKTTEQTYDLKQKSQEVKDSKRSTLQEIVDVIQQERSLEQTRNSCAIHAIHNVLCLLEGSDPVDQKAFDKTYQEACEWRRNFYQNHKDLEGKNNFENHITRRSAGVDWMNHDIAMFLQEKGVLHFEDAFTNHSSNFTLFRYQEALKHQPTLKNALGIEKKAANLRNGIPQLWILNLLDKPNENFSGYYHYIAGKTELKDDKCMTTVFDSLGNTDRTKETAINRIHDIFKNGVS